MPKDAVQTIRLYLFGSPRLEQAGRPVVVDTRKALALLAYLALSGERQAREKLAALLWPDAEAAKAHAALRRTLSTLNTALGGLGLSIERETVGLGAPVWVDVLAFRDLRARAEDLAAQAEAADLYRDDFLAGFSLRDSAPFDDWQFFQAETLKHEIAAVLERLVRAHTAAADYERALSYARRWLALDALHEPAHRQLMRLYAWSGQRAAALRQYHECERVLQAELGVAPLEETLRLYEAIKLNRLAPPTAAQAGPPAPPPARRPAAALPLVGRAAEWAALAAAHTAAGTAGQWVVLDGEAGIGKTRLAQDFLAALAPDQPAVLAARCYHGQANLAYGVIVDVLRAALALPGAAARLQAVAEPQRWEAARLLPELGQAGGAPPLDGPGAQSRFFEGVRQTLLALASAATPGLLFFDDVQWADEASVDLLAYLIRRSAQPPLFIVTTWRGGDVPPHHPLRQCLAEAQRAATGRVLELQRLQPEDVRALAASALPPEALSEAVLARLQGETEGAPLFVVEYLAALACRPDLSGDWPLPAGVRALLSARLAAAGETGQQLLGAAAVIGRSFDLEALQAVSGRSEDETIAALEELVARGLVVEVAAPSGQVAYDFTHEKLRALAYAQTGLGRRRLLHRRTAETLVARRRGRTVPGGGERAAEIAHHFRLGGREPEAAEFFRRAGDHARSVYANAEALAHFQAALSLGYPQPHELHGAIGDLHTLAGDYAAALNSYEAAAATSPAESLGLLEHKLAIVYDRRGDWELADDHFRAAELAMTEAVTPAVQARLYADWSRTAQRRGQAEAAERLAQRALALAQAAGDARALAQAHNRLGSLASRREALAEARHHLEHSRHLAESLDDPDALVAALNNLALVCREEGDLARALSLTQQALGLCVARGDRHREAALHNNLADLYYAQGLSDEAMRHLKQAVRLFADIGAGPQGPHWQPEIWKLTEW